MTHIDLYTIFSDRFSHEHRFGVKKDSTMLRKAIDMINRMI